MEVKPTLAVTFHDEDDGEIGRLSWDTGTMRFDGKAEESAEIFFIFLLKPMVDDYILAEKINTGRRLSGSFKTIWIATKRSASSRSTGKVKGPDRLFSLNEKGEL